MLIMQILVNSMTIYNTPTFAIAGGNYELLKEDIEKFLQVYEIISDLDKEIGTLDISYYGIKTIMNKKKNSINFVFLASSLIGLSYETLKL